MILFVCCLSHFAHFQTSYCSCANTCTRSVPIVLWFIGLRRYTNFFQSSAKVIFIFPRYCQRTQFKDPSRFPKHIIQHRGRGRLWHSCRLLRRQRTKPYKLTPDKKMEQWWLSETCRWKIGKGRATLQKSLLYVFGNWKWCYKKFEKISFFLFGERQALHSTSEQTRISTTTWFRAKGFRRKPS